MTKIYRVVGWNEHFENWKSRSLNHLRFVYRPNKQNGVGFNSIMAQPDGLAIYGAFELLIGLLSLQPAPRNGWCTYGGLPNGRSLTPMDLAIRFHRQETEWQRAIDVLSSKYVGWLDVTEGIEEASSEHREGIEQASSEHRNSIAEASIEGNRREGNRTPPTPHGSPPTNGNLALAARRVLEAMNGERRILPRGFSPTKANLSEITARLRDGAAEDDLLAIIEHKAREVRRNPEARKWFNPTTLFRPRNFDRNLNMAISARPATLVVAASSAPARTEGERDAADWQRMHFLERKKKFNAEPLSEDEAAELDALQTRFPRPVQQDGEVAH